MKDSIFFNLLLLKERKKLKKSMHRELKKLDLEKLSIKKELLLRYKERELRFLERCTRLEKTLKLKVKEEILSKTTLTLDQQCMLQLLEMVFPLIKKQTNMKSNQRLYLLTKELRSSVDLYQLLFSNLRLVLIKSS